MLRNHLNSMAFILGLTTLVGIAEAMIAGVLVPHTIIRIPVLVPGPQLANFTVPMTGVQCMKHCTDTPNCMYIVTRPVSWPDFDKINENKNMYFIEKLRRTELVGCWLFARRGDGKRGTPWIGRGAKQLGKNGEWRYGNLLLAAKRWMEPETGRFNPDDFLALEETSHFGYANDDFRRELENQRPPLCTFTPTVSSLTPEKETTSTPGEEGQSLATPTEENKGSPDPTSYTDGTSAGTTPEETTPTVRDTLHEVRFISYTCGILVYFGWDTQCPEKTLTVSEVIFAKTAQDVGCTNLMPIRYSFSLTTLVEDTTGGRTEAYCARAPCGSLLVPIGLRSVPIPSLGNSFDVYTNVTASASICYAYKAVNF